MKKVFMLIACIALFAARAFSQTLIIPENDSTFYTEYQDGEQWAFALKDSMIVGITNKTVKDDYGSFYKLSIMIRNMTDYTFDFDPNTVESFLISNVEQCEPMKVYTAEKLQKKIKAEQTWASIFTGLSLGLNTANAGYQSANVVGPHGTYSVQTYNTANAALANMMANNQLTTMSKQFEADRKIRDVGYLKRNTIHPGESVCGFMMVNRQRGKKMNVILNVNGTSFNFSWDLKKKKNKECILNEEEQIKK